MIIEIFMITRVSIMVFVVWYGIPRTYLKVGIGIHTEECLFLKGTD